MKTYYRVFGIIEDSTMAALNKHEVFYFDDYDFARSYETNEYITENGLCIRLNNYIERRIIEVVLADEENTHLEDNFKTCYNTMRLKYSLAEIMNMITEMEMVKDGD